MSSTPLKFRGFRAAAAFVTSKGHRGVKAPTQWAQQLIEASENDDTELAAIALESPLADVTAVVEGGVSGAPYSIGEFGFYSEHQFEEPLKHCLEEKHRRLGQDAYVSEEDLSRIDARIEEVVRHSTTRFAGVKRGDTFITIAVNDSHQLSPKSQSPQVYANAYQVAAQLVEKAADIFAVNYLDQDLLDCCKEQSARLNLQLRYFTSTAKNETNTHVLPSEMKEDIQKRESFLSNFQGMISFQHFLLEVLTKRQTLIESERAKHHLASLKKEVK